MAAQKTQDTLLRELRRLNLYPPEVRQLKELRAKIEERTGASESSGDVSWSGRYAVLLYGMALKSLETDEAEGLNSLYSSEEEDSVPDICLDVLSRMGVCGRTMAAYLLCNRLLTFSSVQKWFDKTPAPVSIAVADRMVALDPEPAAKRVEFARSVLKKASSMELREAASFFRENGTRKGQLTFTSLESFMRGNFGTGCRRSLNSPESLDEISTCAENMPSYPEKELILDVAFHLRTMDPVIMRKVLEAVERLADELDDRTLKQIVPLAMSPSIFLARAAMDVIAKFGGKRRGRIFSRIFNESTQTRAELVNRIPLLSSKNFAQFMNSIPKEFHLPVVSTVFSTLSDEDPHCFGAILSSVLKKSRSKKKNTLYQELKEILDREALPEPPQPEMGEGLIMPGEDFIRVGAPIVLNIMKKKSNSGISSFFGKEEDGDDGIQDIYTGGQITNQEIHKLNRWKNRGREIVFRNCSFAACDFRSSFMEKCSFLNCSFEACTFSGASYSGCVFQNCSFSASSMHGALFYECRFESVRFRCSHFDSATFCMAVMEKCSFQFVAAPGAFFCRTRVHCCSFDVADLRDVRFYRSDLKGIYFGNSDFTESFFLSGEAWSVRFDECSTFGMKALNIKTGNSELLKAVNRTLAERLGVRERLKKKVKGSGEADQYRQAVQYKAVRLWFALKDIQRAHGCFSENNNRRLAWSGTRMNRKCAEFVKILPALLHTTVFEKAGGMEELCASSKVKGYYPDLDVFNSLSRLFGDVKVESPTGGFVPVEALMSIGSTGTIAQSPDSDLDCWVCCDFSGSRGDSRERLQFKLRAIEDWADRDFGLEVHFFVMDVREVRENRFGLSDEESSGSAQSALLKEEFYRTALLIAGTPPLWWFTPPEADDTAYADASKKVAALCGRDYFVDLGNVPHIPAREFFGASLWQIVKGVKSPFKSIMKFGLLEMYISGEGRPLLCESIKRNLLNGMRRLRRVDPYMLLYRDLADFYASRGAPEYTWLTAMALRLKCGLLGKEELDAIPACPEEREIIEFASGLAGKDSPGHIKGFKGLSDFRSVVALGDRINQFMIKTYMKVREGQDAQAGSAITPEDLTRLGRVIFSNFAKRRHKVERISLPGSRTTFFDTLIVTRSKGAVWELQGEYPDESGTRVSHIPIESGRDLVSMLVWVVLNGLYHNDMKMRTDMTSAPVRDRELIGLFDSLEQFFPLKEVFKTPVEEALNPEQVVRAFFILNFCSPREDKKVREVHLVYGTNWGEVFCRKLDITTALIETPEAFLRSEMPEICTGPVKMGQFVPQSSVCPFLKIPVN
ncbi:class I adenylate cyclase [Maridesulfovibrio sp.]|uniref:class I adenylate cyclase n=1 Tax=Maridesulfovibrio sp. TaxID=2795000 RepID=UPI002A18738A|nr:class I adenylate cyclase [Maridesulfovibrio sp.]